jgi:hypothetical protein
MEADLFAGRFPFGRKTSTTKNTSNLARRTIPKNFRSHAETPDQIKLVGDVP